MYPVSGENVWHAPRSKVTGTDIIEEIPVELVANILLQHMCRRRKGVVQASPLSYKDLEPGHMGIPYMEEKNGQKCFYHG